MKKLLLIIAFTQINLFGMERDTIKVSSDVTVNFIDAATNESLTTWKLPQSQVNISSVLRQIVEDCPGQTITVPITRELVPALSILEDAWAHLVGISRQPESVLNEGFHELRMFDPNCKMCLRRSDRIVSLLDPKIADESVLVNLLNTADFLGVDLILDPLLDTYKSRLLNNQQQFLTAPEKSGADNLNPDLSEKIRREFVRGLLVTPQQTIDVYDSCNAIRAQVFHPTERQFVSASSDASIKVFQFHSIINQYTCEQRIDSNTSNHHTGSVTAITFHPRAKHFVSGSADNSIRSWWIHPDTAQYFCRQIIESDNGGHSDTVKAVAFHPVEYLFVSGSVDKTIKVWWIDPDSELGRVFSGYRCLQTIDVNSDGHTGSVCALAFHPEGRQFISGSDDHTIKIWEIAQLSNRFRCIQTIRGFAKSLAFHPSGRQFIFGSSDDTIQVWALDQSINQYQCQQAIDKNDGGHTDNVLALAFHPRGEQFISSASAGMKKEVWMFNQATNRYHYQYAFDGNNDTHSVPVQTIVFRPGTGEFVSTDKQTVNIWYLSGSAVQDALKEHCSFSQALLLAIARQRMGKGGLDLAKYPIAQQLAKTLADQPEFQNPHTQELIKLLLHKERDIKNSNN